MTKNYWFEEDDASHTKCTKIWLDNSDALVPKVWAHFRTDLSLINHLKRKGFIQTIGDFLSIIDLII